MKKRTAAILWPIVALALALMLGFVLAASMRPKPVVQVEVVTRGPSAATSICLVLFGTLGMFVLVAIGAVVVAMTARARQHTKQMEKAALLFGARQPQPTPQKRSRVGAGDGPSVVIVSGGGTGPRMEDMRDGYR